MSKKLLLLAALALSLMSGCAELTYEQQQALIQSLNVMENHYRQQGQIIQQYQVPQQRYINQNCYTYGGITNCTGTIR